jgi:hypothetical protein
MEEVKKLIEEKRNELYRSGSHRIGLLENEQLLLWLAETKGVEYLKLILNDDKVYELATSNHFALPASAYKFIDLLCTGEGAVFDPWFSTNSYLFRKNVNGLGKAIMQSEIQLADLLEPKRNYQLEEGNALLTSLTSESAKYVVCFPPFGARNLGSLKASSGDFATDLLIHSANDLQGNPELIFLMSGRFCFDKKIESSLHKHNIGVKAAFHLPEGSHLPFTNISSYLVVAKKDYEGQTFIAELSDNDDSNQTIYNNFQNLRPGRSIELGVLKQFSDFKSFESLSKSEELLRKGRTTGYQPVRLEEIVIENGITSIRNEEWAVENHNSNCVYIPKVGNSPSVTHPSELKINVKNCFRVELTDDSVAPDYLVRFLRTPLGQLSLDSCKTGTAMQSLSSLTLKDVLLFLPNYRDQIRALSIDNKVTAYINDFKEMKERLWSRPREQSSIEDQLKPFEDLNSVERWFDGIPFPLSSILWKYYATTNTKAKYEHLLHFFEALPEFLSMLFLSSFYQKKEFYKTESVAWLNNEPQYREWYKRTDFGSWNNLFANLAKATRSLLNPEKKEITLSLLGRPNSSFLNFITSKSVFNILDTVRQYRSDWKAHGGVSGEEENQTRLTILEEKLNELRKIVKDSFSTCRIVVPGTSSYENGLFKYKVKVLIGNRTPFNEIDVESTKPMDVTKLYMLHEGQNSPVELLPFIRYNQESKACYYYNKVESGNTRWVSFHYEEISEIQVPLDEKFEEVLNVLRQDN